jgi:uncharacterized membrane protein YedE/YeeE
MINPAKVLNFFDIAGSWDPSLAFVMGGGLLTTIIGYRLVFGRLGRPLIGETFAPKATSAIDGRLVGGAAVFGIGWGIAGFCPGGSIPALGLMDGRAFIFVAAMVAGILLARSLKTRMPQAVRA